MSEETASTAEGTTAPESAPPATQEATQEAGAGKAGASDAGDHKSSAAPAASTKRDDKGKFASTDWRSGLEGDDLELAKRFASPLDAVKSVAELRKEISTRIKIPGKDAKPEDITKYRKATGAGETIDAYMAAFPQPEGGQLTDSEKAIRERFAKDLHEEGMPLSGVKKAYATLTAIAQEAETERERVAVKYRGEIEASARKEEGADFDANSEVSKRAVHVFGGEPLQKLLNETIVDGGKLGDNPILRRAFVQIGRRMGEGSFIGAVGSEEVKTALQGMDAKTAAMMQARQAGDMATANRLNNELMEERRRVHGSAPIGRR